MSKINGPKSQKDPLNSFTFATATHPHPEHPENNEDFLLVDRRNGLAVICDGVGSAFGAGLAAQMAARTIRNYWRRIFPLYARSEGDEETVASGLDGMLQVLLDVANDEVLQLGEELSEERLTDGQVSYARTTIALALLYRQQNRCTLAYAHIGDSRVYLLRKDKSLQRLTFDDGYFSLLLQREEINEEDALRIDQASRAEQLTEQEREYFDRRNGITQALGQKQLQPHIGQVELEPGDRVLLCTDGIHDNLTDAEIEHLLRDGARTTIARKLVQYAVERSEQDEEVVLRAKKDDISAIVITYHYLSANIQVLATRTQT